MPTSTIIPLLALKRPILIKTGGHAAIYEGSLHGIHKDLLDLYTATLSKSDIEKIQDVDEDLSPLIGAPMFLGFAGPTLSTFDSEEVWEYNINPDVRNLHADFKGEKTYSEIINILSEGLLT